MASAPSIVSEIAALVPQQQGNRPWYEKVEPAQAELLGTILEAWKAGAFGTRRRTAARAISVVLNKHGIPIGEQGVEVWIRRSE